MSNRVYLWVDRLSEQSLWNMFYHTSICVEFDGGLKFVFSYNESGYRCTPAEQEESPREEIFLGLTTKTLPEVVMHAENLLDTEFQEYSWFSKNCNHFSDKLSMRICGRPIPSKYVTQGEFAVGLGAGIATVALGVLGALFRR